jgi:AcrR family transcriptional regulator
VQHVVQLVRAPELVLAQVLRAREREQVAERVDLVRADEARVFAAERAVGKRLEARGLYDFFPNREAIVVALAEQRLARLAADVKDGLAAAEGLDDAYDAIDLLIRRIAQAVAADRALYRVLLREARFLRDSPETRRALETFFELAQHASQRARDRVALPDPPADVWLIGRVLAHAVLEIAWQARGEPSRERLTESLVRLTFRMLHGRDP